MTKKFDKELKVLVNLKGSQEKYGSVCKICSIMRTDYLFW